jgi:cytochrome b561
VRLAYRLLNPPPPLPPSIQPWQARIAELTHILLYLMVFFMALTGFVRVQAGGFPIEMLNALGLPPIVPRNEVVAETAKMAHGYGRFILALLVLAHIGAALLHGLIKKDGVFSRMWPVLGRN